MRLRFVLVTLVAALGVVAAACEPPPPPPPPPAQPPALNVETYVAGRSIPWDLAFTPDGTLLFTERAAAEIRVVRPDRSVDELAGGAVDLVAVFEGGMMGLAVDPAFGANRRVYACFLSSLPGGGVLDVRVARFTVDAGYTTLANRADIVTGMPVNSTGSAGRHAGCRLRFGPDGYLWVGTGDAATGANPQSLASLGGKVLRVDTNGATAPGNASGGDPRVYTYGHRNVQGLAFRPGSGTPYSVEQGTGCDDEVNRLVAGGNYGWDPGPGYDESTPMTDLTKFPGAVRPAWASGCPTDATSGAAFLSGSQWGDWDGALVVAALKASKLHFMKLSEGGDAVVEDTVTLTDHGRLRSAVQGPDGALYVTTSNGGNDEILRVTRS
ncbi:MAG: PQQ-dependent sugar dehydrogenase [Acidimicrobiia bacterium]|jgi:glucose/arabinose dehydrogenase